jgi:hypothetical protein
VSVMIGVGNRGLARDVGLFAACLFAALPAGHLIFLDSANHSTIAYLGRLWAVLFFVPCLVLSYFARRFAVLQSIALFLVAYVAVDWFDYVPFFHRAALIPAHPSKEYLVTTAAGCALAAFLGVLGALLKKYTTKKRSQG